MLLWNNRLELRIPGGQVHCGRDRIAKVGVRKENVPPCTMGNLYVSYCIYMYIFI